MSTAGPLIVISCRLPNDYARIDELCRALGEDGVGGILLFGGDLDLTPRFLQRLREAASGPILIMSDVERGVGQQIEGCLRLPPPMAVGALRDPGAAYDLGAATAIECRRVGIDVALAPVVDLLNEPSNPIMGSRSFGGDPSLVAELGAAWIEGCQDEGVLACAKHFPGHGRTLLDSHDALPRVDAPAESLMSSDLVPFAAAVRARVGTMMTAHVAYPSLGGEGEEDLPATLARGIIGGLLRERLGYDGLVLTDALIMEGVRTGRTEGQAAVDALRAGCDILLCPTDHREILDSVEQALQSETLNAGVLEGALARRGVALSRIAGRSVARDIAGLDEYRAYAMARASVTVLRDPGRHLPWKSGQRGLTLVVVLDDDDRPAREAPLRERAEEFSGGILRAVPGAAEPENFLAAAESADRIVIAVYGDTRAWKGRAGLHPELDALRQRLEEQFTRRTVTVIFGAPMLAGTGVGSALCAYDDAPMVQRGLLDLLLGGRAATGRLPYGPDPLGISNPDL
jgi:beta-glucosidase-like glycosyl hydrolase